jgi:hypothetical protein
LGAAALNLFKDLPSEEAVHRAYAKRALMKIPSLEDYEQRAAGTNETVASKICLRLNSREISF